MKKIPRDNCWFITHTGRRFYPFFASAGDIHILDIAHALSQINRFGGHTSIPYSVAAHSLLVSALLPAPLKLQGLLHDATEAYIGDMISPIKAALPEFKALEKRLFAAIAEKFGIPSELDPAVKKADLLALKYERNALIRWQWESPLPWSCDNVADSAGLLSEGECHQFFSYVNAAAAAAEFRRRFFDLTKRAQFTSFPVPYTQ